MFDQFKGMASMAGLLKDLPRIKAKLEEIKEQLRDVRVVGEAGGGAVRAEANGHLEIVSIQVDDALLGGLLDAGDPSDRTLAQDLIVGAVNTALRLAREAAQHEMQRAAQELDLPIPPGLLEGLTS